MTFVETDRLILRSWKPEDLPLFTEMNKDAHVMRYFPTTLIDEQTELFYNRIQSEFKRNGWGLYSVELKSNGTLIGMSDYMRLVSGLTLLPELKSDGGWLLIITIRD